MSKKKWKSMVQKVADDSLEIMKNKYMNVKKCPKRCKFNWMSFHKDLDIAVSHMIEENDILPSTTSLTKFIEYSCLKNKLQEKE